MRRTTAFAPMALAVLGFLPLHASEPDSLGDRIHDLRTQARFAEAAEAARTLLERLLAEPDPTSWKIEDAKHLTATLEAAVDLSLEQRRQLAEADRLRDQHREAYRRDDGETSLELAGQELVLRTAVLGDEHLEVADTLRDLGLYHDWFWKDLDLGKSQYRRCLEIRRRDLTPPHPDLATALQRLGTQLRRLDAWGEAEPMLREALEMQRSLFGEEHPDTAKTMHHLAILLVSIGRLEDARVLYEKALSVHRKRLTFEDILLPENMIALGNVYRRLGQLEKAEALYREALALTRQRVGEDGWYVSWAQNYVGAILLYQGRYDEAEELMLEADARLRRIDPDHRQLFQIVGLRGRIALEKGDYEKAVVLLTEALERDRKLRGTDASSHIVLDLERLGMARYHLGDVEGAEALLSEALAGFEEARMRVGSGVTRSRFTNSPYVPLAVLRLELGRWGEAWDAVERARGRALADLVASADPVSHPAETLTLGEIQRTLDDRTAIVGWLDYHLYNGEPRFWGYVIRSSGPVRWERLGDLGVADRRRQVQLLSTARNSDPHLALPYELRDRLATFRDNVADPGPAALGPAVEDESLRAEARALWKERFAPLERHLEDVTRLVVVPSWAMSGFPVGVLLTDDGLRVGDRYAVSYAPSATLYALLTGSSKRHAARTRTGLLVGDPPFRAEHVATMRTPLGEDAGGDGPSTSGAGRRSTRSILRGVLEGDRTAVGNLPRLAWSRDEVQSIAALMDAPLVLLGEAASEQRLHRLAADGILGRYDVVHLATHAVVDETSPERSALVMAQVGEDAVGVEGDSSADGFLTAGEILADWKLDASLVTLSACETGLGENLFGEGVVGFAYPFLHAGASSLLVSLWKVDDEATALLMTRFYQEWMGDGDTAAPSSKTRALQRAARWLRDHTEADGGRPFEHPYYWAGFVLIGDPG